MLINVQTLSGTRGKMPAALWKQWAKERPKWMQREESVAFERFMGYKWRDSLNITTPDL